MRAECLPIGSLDRTTSQGKIVGRVGLVDWHQDKLEARVRLSAIGQSPDLW